VILVDTSVWIDHLHRADRDLATLLERVEAAAHPMVVGQLALGAIRRRAAMITLLRALPSPPVASGDEVLDLVERRRLFGRGLSLIDAHLLASTLLEPGMRLWSRDRRLSDAAASLGVSYRPGRR
jgi:predicted nucleic acid-binding protein